MTPPTSPDQPVPELPASDDSIGKGVGYSILWQIAAIIITLPVFCIVWSLVQWIALLPMYFRFKKRPNPLAAKAVLITGFVGMLVNGACAALVLGNLGNMH
jgi:hypothetical protein